MKRLLAGLAVAGGVLVGAAPGTAFAHRADPPCTITPAAVAVGQTYVVSVSGLPALSAINLWVTTPGGVTSGSPLGSTPNGSFNLDESSSSAGTWTYAFSGPTGHNMQVYATCSVTAS